MQHWGGAGRGVAASTHSHGHTCKSKPSTACDEVRRRGVNRVCRYHGSHFHLAGLRETEKHKEPTRWGGSDRKNSYRQTDGHLRFYTSAFPWKAGVHNIMFKGILRLVEEESMIYWSFATGDGGKFANYRSHTYIHYIVPHRGTATKLNIMTVFTNVKRFGFFYSKHNRCVFFSYVWILYWIQNISTLVSYLPSCASDIYHTSGMNFNLLIN